jgi:hypothetical protein
MGFTPFLGALAAVAIAADAGWMKWWQALIFFLAPFWLFALFAFPAKHWIVLGPPARGALRLLRAPRLRRTGDEGVPAGAR